VVNAVFQDLGHPREVCGRQNIARVVDTAEGLTFGASSITLQNAVSKLFEILAVPASDSSCESPGRIPRLAEIIEWLQAIDEISATPWMHKRRNFTICAGANSKIMASILQHRSGHGGSGNEEEEESLV
jgi:hypothetical protein